MTSFCCNHQTSFLQGPNRGCQVQLFSTTSIFIRILSDSPHLPKKRSEKSILLARDSTKNRSSHLKLCNHLRRVSSPTSQHHINHQKFQNHQNYQNYHSYYSRRFSANNIHLRIGFSCLSARSRHRIVTRCTGFLRSPQQPGYNGAG